MGEPRAGLGAPAHRPTSATSHPRTITAHLEAVSASSHPDCADRGRGTASSLFHRSPLPLPLPSPKLNTSMLPFGIPVCFIPARKHCRLTTPLPAEAP
jgi:hypothetical protein